ncbi:MAG: DUF2752 domain-containing protein [Cyanobacteriota bacterium]|nr:DUF2752 domain-containing protein [Cyanobacteriota bacterium]
MLNKFLQRIQTTGYLLPATLTGYLWLKGLHPGLPGWGCPLRELTGIPCPTCFLTRATAAALIGDVKTSVSLHVFGPIVACVLIYWSLFSLKNKNINAGRPKRHIIQPIGIGVIGYWLIRLAFDQWPELSSSQ